MWARTLATLSRASWEMVTLASWRATATTSSGVTPLEPRVTVSCSFEVIVMFLLLVHGDADAAFVGDFDGAVVAGVDVADDAHAGVVGQEPFELFRGQVRSVSDGNLPGVQGPANTDTTAVMDRHPGSTRRGVQQGIQQRPVSHRVRPVSHGLGLPVRGRHRTGIQVVTADHDRSLDLALLHQLVEQQPG